MGDPACYGCGLAAARAHDQARFVCNWDATPAQCPTPAWNPCGDTSASVDHHYLLETARRLYQYMMQTQSSEFGVRQIHKDVFNVVHHAQHMSLDAETCAFYQLLGNTFLYWSSVAVECA